MLEPTNLLDDFLTDWIIYKYENRHWINKDLLWAKFIRS